MKAIIRKYLIRLFGHHDTQWLFSTSLEQSKKGLTVLTTKAFYRLLNNHINLGLLNRHVIGRQSQTIWPFWVNHFYSLAAQYPSFNGPSNLLTNTAGRQWTRLTCSGHKEQCTIDPRGLITPYPKGWSIDHWISLDGILLSPAQMAQVAHQYHPAYPMIQTSFQHTSLKTSLSYFLSTNDVMPPMICHQTTVKNVGDVPLSFSYFVAIRPYNTEGLSPIDTIHYLTQNCFIVNDQLGPILDQTPDNIICSTHAEGDVSLYINSWEMILNSHCKHRLASAVAEYRITLPPRKSKQFSYRMPLTKTSYLTTLFQNKFNPMEKKRLNKKINHFRTETIEKEKKHFQTRWTENLTKMSILSIPNVTYDLLWQQNCLHLFSSLSVVPSPEHRHGYSHQAVFLSMALNRLGLSDQVEAFLLMLVHHPRKFKLHYIDVSRKDSAGHLLFMIYDYFRFTQNKSFLELIFPMIDQCVNTIRHQLKLHTSHKPIKSIMPRSTSLSQETYDYYFQDNLWALSGLKVARKMATVLKQTEKEATYWTLQKMVQNGIQDFIETTFKETPNHRHLPVSLKRTVDSHLIYGLQAIFPLNIYDAQDPLILTTLQHIEQRFLSKNLLIDDCYCSGVSPFQNAILAHTYLALNNSQALKSVRWLMQSASSTGCWPQYLHPQTHFGIQGEGHDLLASASYVLLIRRLLIKENEKTLELFPMADISWFKTDGKIVCEKLTTSFGRISFTLTWQKRSFHLDLSHDFHTQPVQLLIRFPFIINTMRASGTTRKINKSTMVLPKQAKKILFECDTDKIATETTSDVTQAR